MTRKFEELDETVKNIRSGTSAIHICGDDYKRIDEFVKQLALEMNFIEDGSEAQTKKKVRVHEWNNAYGNVDFETKKIPDEKKQKQPFKEFLKDCQNKNYAKNRIFLIRNACHVLEGENNRENLAQLEHTIIYLKKFLQGEAVLIYNDVKKFIPAELESLVDFLVINPPSSEELKEITRDFIAKNKLKLNKESIERLSLRCHGMSEDLFRKILNKAKLEKGKSFAEAVLPMVDEAKKSLVEKSGLLKYENTDDMDNVGGLGKLKQWLKNEEKAFKEPEEAEKRGIPAAKGIMLIGMPGCGKSLASKAVANLFKLPLLSLDLGSLMNKYVGKSEKNLRQALKLADDSSPCVLWVDEIEKAFDDVGSDGNGVSKRLFGYFLKWQNEKTTRVYLVATANDVTKLPPEFLRRFDELFYIDFPKKNERKEIFKIHLGKSKSFKGKDNLEKIFAKNENFRQKFDELIKNTEGYSGSNIESLVIAANKRAWNEGKDPKKYIFDILLSERVNITPLKEKLAAKIEQNEKKLAEYKLTLASGEDSGDFDPSSFVKIHIFAGPKGHKKSVRSVAFSPDSKYIVSGSNDKTLILWDIKNKQDIYTPDKYEGWVRSVAFSKDDKYIVLGADNTLILLVRGASNRWKECPFESHNGHTRSILSVAFSPDSKYIVSGAKDETVKLWDAENRQFIRDFKGHKGQVNSVAFSPNGKYIVSGGGQTVIIWGPQELAT